jgi:hypothetical protein
MRCRSSLAIVTVIKQYRRVVASIVAGLDINVAYLHFCRPRVLLDSRKNRKDKKIALALHPFKATVAIESGNGLQ